MARRVKIIFQMTIIKGRQLTTRIENAEFKEELLLNEGPIPTDEGKIANKIYLCDYREKNDPEYSILSIKIEWDDDITYESIYDTGRATNTLENVKEMIVGSFGQELTEKGIVVTIESPPNLVEIANHCLMFREMNF